MSDFQNAKCVHVLWVVTLMHGCMCLNVCMCACEKSEPGSKRKRPSGKERGRGREGEREREGGRERVRQRERERRIGREMSGVRLSYNYIAPTRNIFNLRSWSNGKA